MGSMSRSNGCNLPPLPSISPTKARRYATVLTLTPALTIDRSIDPIKVQEDVHVEKRVYRHVDKVGGHRNILRLLTSFEDDDHEHFVLEYCVRGDLFTMVQEAPHQHLPASQVLHYAHQICHGLSFLHSHHVFASFQRHGIRALLRGWNVLPRFSMDAVDLVEKLLVMIPATRLTVAQVLRHPYLTPPQHHPVPKHAMTSTPEHAGSSCHSKMEHKTRSSGGVHRFFQRVFRKAVGSTNQSTLSSTLHDDSSERTLCNDTPNNQMCT
ncbi:hypothetical protein DYB25_006955 [Aphanomyces astaci]|uniref:Protein kinase domain-containing protein n=1 Tax=Aphanomyces astaci TaxID=112090 RepID=A0A396ZV49_APHAT|nr:hypothetical protein DYB25_006955 [Aphanomyces astaci]RHY17351.1 hypothetical protein DYB36_010963 [Aphanomyces astaci]RHY65347.1 hypothetical protein DYB34_007755 [Aphanomyces astaci]